MGRRDWLFFALIFGAVAALGSSLAPSRARTTTTTTTKEGAEPPDFRAVVSRVDQSLRRTWSEQHLNPASRAPDLTIARRLSLALTGTIPSLEEIRRFEAMPPGDRIGTRLDEVFEDRRFADYLAERLARSFVGVEGGPFLIFRRRRFVTWLADELARNRPYDALVRDLIAGQGLWTDHPATNFVTVAFDTDAKAPNPERLAARVARAFLGARIDCAQCHDHPFQPWKRADFRGLAAFFAQTRSSFTGIGDGPGEFEVDDKKTGHPTAIEPRVPYAPELDPRTGTRRERLARWTTDPGNHDFARAISNRTWALMFGRPLVEPIDDLAAAGAIPEPLAILAHDFVTHGHDLRRLIRVIAATEAFGLDSATDSQSESGTTPAQEAAWASFPLTRLRPEQVAGALLQAANPQTINADSHILTRLATYAGLNEFVGRHGDPGEDEFNLEATSTIPQRLLMMNGDLIEKKTSDELANAAVRFAILAPDDAKSIEAAYLATLTRRPTPAEAAHFARRLDNARGQDRKDRMTDLVWTLLNATEFSWAH